MNSFTELQAPSPRISLFSSRSSFSLPGAPSTPSSPNSRLPLPGAPFFLLGALSPSPELPSPTTPDSRLPPRTSLLPHEAPNPTSRSPETLQFPPNSHLPFSIHPVSLLSTPYSPRLRTPGWSPFIQPRRLVAAIIPGLRSVRSTRPAAG